MMNRKKKLVNELNTALVCKETLTADKVIIVKRITIHGITEEDIRNLAEVMKELKEINTIIRKLEIILTRDSIFVPAVTTARMKYRYNKIILGITAASVIIGSVVTFVFV